MATKTQTWKPIYQVCRQLPDGSRQVIASYFTLEEAQIRAKVLAAQKGHRYSSYDLLARKIIPAPESET